MDSTRRNLVAQWAFDTRPILGRFHLWLEDVEQRWLKGAPESEPAFVGGALERAFVVTAGVTALGTRLWGRFGEGRNASKDQLNRVKKDADAMSAYAMSEALWYLTRSLPENHAVMVSLGEGLMPKAGETPEMGANPLLGFGRVYARPQIARFLERRVNRLVNQPGYEWQQFWDETRGAGISVWGAAIDTLENTSRFATGQETGPMTVLHLFNQPLQIARPYEGYIGILALPKAVVDQAVEHSVLLDYLTPRRLVMDTITATYPELPPERVHVWTLAGPSRQHRIGSLWQQWRELGAHLVEPGWPIPQTGGATFTDSGTYAPSYRVGMFTDDQGRRNVFVGDGYAASAEAMQAASLDPILGIETSMALFTSKFESDWSRERRIMSLDPDAADFADALTAAMGTTPSSEQVLGYRRNLHTARDACLPLGLRTIKAGDLFPEKHWEVLAVNGFMLPDPYSGAPGVEQVAPGVYRVMTRAGTSHRLREVALTFRLMEPLEEMRLVFSPLLDRFYAGQDYTQRPVKVSDSGRIRNELQTLCSEALEPLPGDRLCLDLDHVEDAVLPPDKRQLIRQVLTWYKRNHPIWFHWLEL